MKTLMLLRHAKSDWSAPDLADHDRPLNERGEAAADRMARYFADQGLRPGLILCSTARRTRETLSHLLTAWKSPPPARFEKALYLASPRTLQSLIQRTDPGQDSLLLIGHNPGMQVLAASLASTGPKAALADIAEKFPTGALAILTFDGKDWNAVRPGAGTLARFIKPRQLD